MVGWTSLPVTMSETCFAGMTGEWNLALVHNPESQTIQTDSV